MERDFGLPAGTEMVSFNTLAAQCSCLVAFLRAAIICVRGDTSRRGDMVYFGPPDGSPDKSDEWAWHGIYVPGALEGVGPVYAGIITYCAAPPGERCETYLELYRQGRDDKPLAYVPFNPPDLSSTSQDTALTAQFEVDRAIVADSFGI